MRNSSVNKFLAAVVASGLVIASCSGEDDASTRETDSAIGGEEAPAATDASADGDASMQDEFGADAEDRLADPTEEPGESSDAVAESGGLFEPDEPDVEDPPSSGQSFEDSRFQDYEYRDFISTTRDAQSTFALDVDTGAFTIGRRAIENGSLPPRESVRPEE